MNNDLDTARAELAQLIEKAPDHPRREFLQTSIDRAAELQKFAAPEPASLRAAGRRAAQKSPPPARTRCHESTPERVVARAPERSVPPRIARRDTAAAGFEVAYLRRADQRAAARIHHPAGCADQFAAHDQRHPARRTTSAGRTVEASDSAVGRQLGRRSPMQASAAAGLHAIAGHPPRRPPRRRPQPST